MDLLSRSTILYINQTRQDNFDKLIGKGFYEAFLWRKLFKNIIFVCYSSTNKFLYKKIYANCYLMAIPFDISSSTLKSTLNIGRNYLKLFIFLFKLTKIININIIRMENLLLSGLPIYFISKLRTIPFVIWLGGDEKKSLYIKYNKNPFTWFLATIVSLLERIILRNANFVFPVTDDLVRIVQKRKVVNKILSPNYVDISKFKDFRSKNHSFSKEKIHVLYVGRFEEEKGIKILLKAIQILSEEEQNFYLSMVGEGSLKIWIENFININKIKNVQLLGKFDHEEMPKIYNSAEIFILPSYTEGSPASLIEAMSCGLASIATAVGESKKIITNGHSGYLVPPGNPNKIAEAIKSLLKNKEILEKFRINGRISILNYIKDYKKMHKFVYEKVLQNFDR